MGRGQLARLFRLIVLLQSEPNLNAKRLSERCEVSVRTIYRDIEALQDAGIPVHFDRREQGYCLEEGFFFQPPSLSESEGLALLLMANQRGTASGLGLLKPALDGSIKVVQGLPDEARRRVIAVSGALRESTLVEDLPPQRKAINEAILAGLVQQRQVRLWYRVRESLLTECTKFALYRILLQDRHWFLVGRSSLYRRVEIIGVPWIERVVLTEDPYTIPPRFNLERFLANSWGIERSRFHYLVRLAFSAKVAPEVDESHRHRALTRKVRPDGSVEYEFAVDGLDEILRWVLSFGDQVEVLAPPELVSRVHRVASILADRTAGKPDGTS